MKNTSVSTAIALLLLVATAASQDIQLHTYSFDTGFSISSASNTQLQATVSEPVVGVTKGSTFAIVSGFLVDQWFEIAVGSVQVRLKVYLQGPFSAGVMTTTLDTSGFIPHTSDSAYSAATYGYTASTVTSIPNTNIVDWLLVELRSDTAGATKAASRAGFLKSVGTVVDIDGTSPLSFTGVSPGNYYIVVRHRNHLAIMSATAVALSSASALYDFTTAQTQAYGTSPMAALTGGAFGMIAGDVNQDGVVKYNLRGNDRALIYARIGGGLVNTTVRGYYPEDVNLDGIVKYNLGGSDRAIIYVNIGSGAVNATVSTKVPDAGLPEGGVAVKASVLKKEPK